MYEKNVDGQYIFRSSLLSERLRNALRYLAYRDVSSLSSALSQNFTSSECFFFTSSWKHLSQLFWIKEKNQIQTLNLVSLYCSSAAALRFFFVGLYVVISGDSGSIDSHRCSQVTIRFWEHPVLGQEYVVLLSVVSEEYREFRNNCNKLWNQEGGLSKVNIEYIGADDILVAYWWRFDLVRLESW